MSSPQPAGEYTPPGPLVRLLQSARERGPVATARSAAGWSLRFAGGPAVARRVRGARSFELGGVRFDYRDDWYNWTWLGERAVEIPIAAAALNSADPGRTIEVGAVMSHYGYNTHRVIDRYEQGEGIEQIDIFDLPPTPVHDLVLSVSTLEHVGWDESPRDAELALKAVDHLKRLVAPGGELLVTVPVGYHPRLDAAARSGALGFHSARALSCSYPSMIWQETAAAEVAEGVYDKLICRAEAVLICRWTNETHP